VRGSKAKTDTFTWGRGVAERGEGERQGQGGSRREWLGGGVLRESGECEGRGRLGDGGERDRERGVGPEVVAGLVEA